MSTEELLQPRFKVIANFPGSWFDIGEITKNNFASFDLEDYPNIFKKLKWWEERNIKDLPEYLKQEKDGKIYNIYKVLDYVKRLNHSELTFDYDWGGTILYDSITLPDLLPATKEEYENNKII